MRGICDHFFKGKKDLDFFPPDLHES